MAANEYHFVTHWRVESTVEEIFEIISHPDLARWWPSVYLKTTILKAGDERGLGRETSLHTKGWLPYTLRWDFRITDVNYPYGFTLEAQGDFVGQGIWTFEQDGAFVNITYDWRIRADKPLLRSLSFIMKPVFSANHEWAMRQGEESLKLELARRHASSPEEASRVPAPPGPVSTMPFLVFGVVMLLIGVIISRRIRIQSHA